MHYSQKMKKSLLSEGTFLFEQTNGQEWAYQSTNLAISQLFQINRKCRILELSINGAIYFAALDDKHVVNGYPKVLRHVHTHKSKAWDGLEGEHKAWWVPHFETNRVVEWIEGFSFDTRRYLQNRGMVIHSGRMRHIGNWNGLISQRVATCKLSGPEWHWLGRWIRKLRMAQQETESNCLL